MPMPDVPESALVLHHAPQSRSIVAQWMLEELGEPFTFQLVNLRRNEQRGAEHLAVNPMGKVPALRHGAVLVTEAAAICAYLADAFPQAGLAPPHGDPLRGPYYRWLFFGPSCLEPAIVDRMLKREPGPAMMLGYGDFDTLMEVLARAVSHGPYLLGEQFTAADVVIGAGLQWGMMTGAVPARPEFTAYADRLKARPALQRVYAKDAELVAAQQN